MDIPAAPLARSIPRTLIHLPKLVLAKISFYEPHVIETCGVCMRGNGLCYPWKVGHLSCARVSNRVKTLGKPGVCWHLESAR